jgi:GAF domain-containing protein
VTAGDEDRTGDSEIPYALAAEFAEIAHRLVSEPGAEATLTRMCLLARGHIEGCASATVTLVEGRRQIHTHGATDVMALAFDDVQYETGEGPGLDAIRSGPLVEVSDLAADGRWPRFAPLAIERTGVRSVLSIQLSAGGDALGALNLYSPDPGGLQRNPNAVAWGSVFAAHASIALLAAQQTDNLRAALESRETISVAIGMLMGRQGLSRAEAFDVLRRASQRLNVKLRDVARSIAGGAEIGEAIDAPRPVPGEPRSFERDRI